MNWLKEYANELFYLVAEMAPYLLLGFLFAGILKVYLPQRNVQKYLGKPGFKSSLYATLFGIPMPLCSCGVIPTGVSLYKNGASKSATSSFLISTPQTGVDSIFATYALLGLPFAIIRPIVALITGVFGGLLSGWADKKQLDSGATPGGNTASAEVRLSGKEKVKTIFRYGFGELVEDIAKWLIIGLMLAALLSVLIPESFFSNYIGNPFLEMGIVLAASIPLYICATGSIPLAAVLLMKGLSPGAALVLLMAGPATNIATMTVIGKSMGRRALVLYMVAIIAGALVFGFLINWLLPASWFSVAHLHEHAHDFLPEWLTIGSAIVLLVLILGALYRRFFPAVKSGNTQKEENSLHIDHMITQIEIEGMTCHHCERAVETNLEKLEGIESVQVNLKEGSAQLSGEFDLASVKQTIEGLGYIFKGKKS